MRRIEPEPRTSRYPADALVAVPNESYGHKARRLRLLLGLTQWQVAEMVGCTPEALGMWESGRRHGITPEAAELPRRAILLLGNRLRNQRKANGTQ